MESESSTDMRCGNGRDWSQALPTIQETVDRAGEDEAIFVRSGRYLNNDTDVAIPIVRMRSGTSLHGGFAGHELRLADRDDPKLNPTMLDGEMWVQTIVRMNTDTRLDGFQIRDGWAGSGSGIPLDPATIGAGVLLAGPRRRRGL